jgi:tRNA threonylcarbamoyladenosine biosynthesis protein TsaE
MDFPFSVVVQSEIETNSIAGDFSKYLNAGDVVLLNGELGAGKTFFVKSVCSNFGIQNVSSPSFAIVNEYNGTKKIYHFDFYRIKREQELFDIGFREYLSDEAIVFIEWADLFPEILPHKYWIVNLEFESEVVRKINIKKNE